MAGTRIKDVLRLNPDMEQKNILTIIDKTDKVLQQKGFGYSVRPHYDFYAISHIRTRWDFSAS
jgi:hypothetical protein